MGLGAGAGLARRRAMEGVGGDLLLKRGPRSKAADARHTPPPLLSVILRQIQIQTPISLSLPFKIFKLNLSKGVKIVSHEKREKDTEQKSDTVRRNLFSVCQGLANALIGTHENAEKVSRQESRPVD